MDQTGFVAIALAGLWIAYLVPHRLRYRQQLLDSCVEDRFSGELRVLRVAGAWSAADDGRGDRDDVATFDAVRSTGRIHPVRALPSAGTTSQEPTPGPERGGRTMDRPHAGRDRAVADAARHTASEHAARAAYLARRAAAARRRAALTAVLLLAVAAGWGAVVVGSLSVVVGAVPTVLLGGVLVLGRRAVIAGARADARWAAGEGAKAPVADAVRAARSRSAAPTVVGRAVHPSDATTEVMARVGERREAGGAAPSSAEVASAGADTAAREAVDVEQRAAESASAADGAGSADSVRASAGARGQAPAGNSEPVAETTSSTWVPVPVPRPAYTLKPMARRPEPAPLLLDAEPSAAPTADAADTTSDDAATSGTGTSSGTGVATDGGAPTTGGLSLDAILARRRAAGE